jgi:hypothetical protein
MLQDRLTNVAPVLNTIAGIIRKSFGEQFSAGGNPPWKDLAASTIAQKTAAGLPGRTAKGNIPWRLKQAGAFGPANKLIATGALRDSYRVKGAKGHLEDIDVAARTVRVGSDLKTPDGKYSLARIHQDGTRAYTIVAKNGKLLRFLASQGKTVYTRSVEHPGLVARPVRIREEDIAAIKAAWRAHLLGQGEQQNAA